MANYPKIDLPCPLKLTSLPEPGNDFCRHCQRRVHNLTAMTEAGRRQFMASCSGSVCVAYSVKVKPSEKKIAWAMAMAATVAAAVPAAATAACDPMELAEEVVVTGGGVNNPARAQWHDADDEKPSADLPVIVADVDFEAGPNEEN